MFDFVVWQERLQVILGEFTVAVTSFIKQLPGMSQPDAEAKLEEYGRELTSSSARFSDTKLAYKNAVEAYLDKFPPAFSNDLANNLREYDKLIVFSLRSNDKALLSTWGVKKLSQRLTWINDPSERSRHRQGLKDLSVEKPGAEEHFDYLIRCLK